MAGYDRYIYNTTGDNDYAPVKNALTLSPFYDLKPMFFRVDYAYYFGDQKVHRIMPSVSVTLQKKGFLKIDKIAFAPAVYLLFGNETLTDVEVVFAQTRAGRQHAVHFVLCVALQLGHLTLLCPRIESLQCRAR